jgi:hypothetical protein
MLLPASADARVPLVPPRCRAVPAVKLCSIHWHVRHTNAIRARLGYHTLHYYWMPERRPTLRAYYLERWTERHRHWRRLLAAYLDHPWLHDPWYSQAMCIHHYEGSWDAYNSAGPYYGGFQMDAGFMADYGPEYLRAYGDARHWPVRAQLRASWRAYAGWTNPATGRRFAARGWNPWPNTARMCGLL